MNNASDNQEIKNMQIPLRVFVIACILSVTFFLLMLDSVKMYRSTVSILVIPKSALATEQKDSIIYNVMQFPHLLSFYEKLLRENPQVKDTTSGLSQDKRKAIWNDSIQVRHTESSQGTIIELSSLSKKQSDAELLVRKSAQTLFSVTSGYYNVKDDLDIRIIDGPISSTIVTGWYWLAVLSLVLGSAAAFVLQKLFTLTGDLVIGKREKIGMINNSLRDLGKSFLKPKTKEITSLEQLYLAQDQEHMIINKKPAPEMRQVTEPTEYPNFPEMPTTHVMKDEAPDNLPIAEEYVPFQAEEIQEEFPEPTAAEEIIIETPKHHEPTQAELKERLNQLLKGKI